MTLVIENYATFVFDCDGVILNSNHVKTQAFYKAALPYGEAAARALVDHHISNGGISRYKKFEYFLSDIVPLFAPDVVGPSLDRLLIEYAERIRKGLLICEIAEGLATLRRRTAHVRWLIVSGGDQSELRDILNVRGLAELFDGGIFGSPDSKDVILARETKNGNLQTPALLFGDSKYDYHSARAAGIDFFFLWGWSEVSAHESWSRANNIKSIKKINDLLKGSDSGATKY